LIINFGPGFWEQYWVYAIGALLFLIIESISIAVLLRNSQQHKRMELELRESEERFRAIFEYSPDGILIADLQNKKFHSANAVMCKELGYTPEEIIKLRVSDIHPDKDLAYVINQFERQQSGEFTLARDIPVKRKDGSVFYADVNSIVITLSGEKYLLGLFRDITERKQAEDLLRESEERFRGAFETAAIGMAVVSLDGRWVKVNTSLCNIVGYSEQELLTITDQEITHPDDLEIDRAFVKSLLAGAIPYYHIEKRYLHKQGHIIWIILSLSLVKDINGNPLYFVNLIEDITQRKKTEDDLHRSEAKYRSLVESIDDSMYLVNKDCKYLFLNGKHLSRLGPLRRDDILGKPYSEFHSAEETKEFAELVGRVFQTGKSVHYEYKSCRDNKYFMRTLSPVKEPKGEIIAVTVVSKDITELKTNEENREKLISELQEALSGLENAISEVNKLSGLLPICASCKKIRDDKGYWKQIESYISEHSEADFTHAVCPECAKELYPEYYKEIWGKEDK